MRLSPAFLRRCPATRQCLRFAIPVLDTDDTEQADLRGGRSPWFAAGKHPVRLDVGENLKCDALIVGGGITGSLIAERLTRQGLDVIILDRELPGRGSTAASTSMLLWEIDRSLAQLTEIYGFDRASRAYLASLHAVARLKSLVLQLGIACEMRDRNSLLLAAGDTGAGIARGTPIAPARRLARRISRSCVAARHVRNRARGRHRVAGLGRCRPDAAGARNARHRRQAWRPDIRSRGRAVRCRRAFGRCSPEQRPRDRGPLGDPRDRLCDARYRSLHRPRGFVELGDRDDAAAAKHLEGRRADLGRQQGLSLCADDGCRTHHHRR